MNFVDEPLDGWQPFERLFLRHIVLMIYKSIDDPTDRFVLVMTQEAGYTQEEVALILNISQEAVSKRLNKVISRVKQEHV